MPARKAPKPPAHLRRPSAEWWEAVRDSYELEPHHTHLLTLACEAYDRCQQAREIIEAEGITVRTADGGAKAHPAIAVERDSRLAFARLLRELDLDVSAPAETARLPGLRSNRRI